MQFLARRLLACGLFALAFLAGCSPAPKGNASHGTAQEPPRAPAFRSEVAGLKIAVTDRLPAHVGDLGENTQNCDAIITKPQTPEGRAVQAKGWAVFAEADARGYRTVSFAGSVSSDITGLCIIGNGNVALFKNGALKAIVYTAKGAQREIGVAAPIEQGDLRIFDTAWPGRAFADMRFGADGSVTIHPLAAQEKVCGGKAVVPNIYGMKLDQARNVLRTAGWSPEPGAGKTPDARFQNDPPSVAFYADHGLPEVEGCGFGLTGNQCGFAYKGTAGRLEVTTNDMQPDWAPDEKWDWPKVIDYDVTCH